MTTWSGSASGGAFDAWLARHGLARETLPPGSALARLAAGPQEPPPAERPARRVPGPPLRVLMLLCQKVGATGSGVVVKEMIDRAEEAGARFHLICGGEPGDEPARLFARPPERLEVVPFGTGDRNGLPFPIAGMSNDMPYASRAWKNLTPDELSLYLEVWAGRIRRARARFRPHLLHVHHLWLLAGLAALEAPDLPAVVSVHGTDLFRAGDAPHLAGLLAPWAERCAAILTLTEEASGTVRSLYPVAPGGLAVTGNGYNPELFRPVRPRPGEAAPLLRRLGLPEPAGRPVVLCVAKYDRRKGIDWLIRAFARCVPGSGYAPGPGELAPLLWIAGSGPRERRESYLALAARLGVAGRLHLAGAVDYQDVGALMGQARCFALPAFREPFGLVLLEALACGCRVIATDQAGPPTFLPAERIAAGDAVLIPGLPGLDPGPAEEERFVADLAAVIASQLGRAWSAEDRQRIAASVRHLTWGGYARRLGGVYRRAVRHAGSGPGAVRLRDLHARLDDHYARLAEAARSAAANRVRPGLALALAGPGEVRFPPAASIAVLIRVPRRTRLHAALLEVTADLRARFPAVARASFWQPPGTYHLNVAILRRLAPGVLPAGAEAEILARAVPALDELAHGLPYEVDFRGVLIAGDGVVLARGYPASDAPARIRARFAAAGFPDQQPFFHLTLGRILEPLPPALWRDLLAHTGEQFGDRDLGTLAVREALLVAEREGFLHDRRAYRVLRRIRRAPTSRLKG